MQTKVSQNSEKMSLMQQLSIYQESQDSSNEGSSAASDASKEFSDIMDKIAARLNDNLGYDYTSLLANTAAPQAQQKIEVVRKQEVQADTQTKEVAKSEFKVEVQDKNKATKETKADKDSSKQESKDPTATTAKTEKDAEQNKVATSQDKEVKVKEVKESKQVKDETQKESANQVATENQSQQLEAAAEQVSDSSNAVKVKSQDKQTLKAEAKVAQETEVSEEVVASVEASTEQVAATSESSTQVADEGKQAEVKAEMSAKVAKEAGLKEQIFSALLSGQASTSSKEGSISATAKAAPVAIDTIKGVADLVKEKILGSANGNLNGNSMSQTGSLFTKQGSEKAEAPREKLFLQQPQMFKSLEKVESALKEAAKSKDGKTISLRLDPPNLGTVKVDVSLKDGSLHARINADAQTVGNMLREHSHDLQQALRKLGLNVEKVTVSISSSSEQFTSTDSGFNGNFQQGNQQNESASEGHGFGSQLSATTEATAAGQASASESITLDHWVA